MPISKKLFFCQTLIPAGQLVTLIVAIARRALKPKMHSALASRLFEPLHLAAAHALNPTTMDVDELDSAVCDYIVELSAPFYIGRNGMEQLLEVAMDTSTYLRHTGNVYQLVQQFGAAAQNIQVPKAIETEVGYVSSERHKWLQEHLCTDVPVMSNGRFNKWLTFVRNGQWDVFARALDHSPEWQLRAHKRFSTRTGREQWAALWQATFPSEAVVTAEAVPAAAAESAAVPVPGSVQATLPVEPRPVETGQVVQPLDNDRLPSGVAVVTSSDQRLQVKATFKPTCVLSPTQRVTLRATGPEFTHPLTKVLAAQEWSQFCGVATLSATILQASEWLASKKAEAATTVPVAYHEWKREKQMAALLEKLKVSFVPQEYALLSEVLAKQMAASST
jgi:hypothetical protein